MHPKRYLKLKKPLELADLRFDETGLFLKGIRGAVMPMDIFVLMIAEMFDEAKTPKKVVQIKKHVFETGRLQGKQIISEMLGSDVLPFSAANLALILKQIQISGLGDVEVMKFNHHNPQGLIRVNNSSFATQYKKLFSVQKEPVDFFLAGVISGTMESFYGEEFKVVETSCVVQGKSSCVFEVSSKKKK